MELVDGLPPSVADFVVFLARMARGYDNKLKWNEQDKFKAELMNVPERWMHVDAAAFYAKTKSEGMREEDSLMLLDWLKKRQAGRRLVPSKSYRSFRMKTPPEMPDEEMRSTYSNPRW